MKLKFYARGTHLVSYPRTHRVGSPPRYIGREAQGRELLATAEPFECEAESFVGARLLRLMQSGARHGDLPLWPADAATAAACGVKFAQTKFEGGEHRIVAPEIKPKKE